MPKFILEITLGNGVEPLPDIGSLLVNVGNQIITGSMCDPRITDGGIPIIDIYGAGNTVGHYKVVE